MKIVLKDLIQFLENKKGMYDYINALSLWGTFEDNRKIQCKVSLVEVIEYAQNTNNLQNIEDCILNTIEFFKNKGGLS